MIRPVVAHTMSKIYVSRLGKIKKLIMPPSSRRYCSLGVQKHVSDSLWSNNPSAERKLSNVFCAYFVF